MNPSLEPSPSRAPWHTSLHFTKGQVIAILFLILLAPFAGFFTYILWIAVHPNDHVLGVGRLEVAADQGQLDISIAYDQNSEMEPSVYTSATTDAITQILLSSGVTKAQIQRPYDSRLTVTGFTSEGNFATLNKVQNLILDRFPKTYIVKHYAYVLTPEAKSQAFLSAITNAHQQADGLGKVENRKVVYFRASTCKTLIIDSTQVFNPSACSDTIASGSGTDTSPTKQVIVTVDANVAYSF